MQKTLFLTKNNTVVFSFMNVQKVSTFCFMFFALCFWELSLFSSSMTLTDIFSNLVFCLPNDRNVFFTVMYKCLFLARLVN